MKRLTLLLVAACVVLAFLAYATSQRGSSSTSPFFGQGDDAAASTAPAILAASPDTTDSRSALLAGEPELLSIPSQPTLIELLAKLVDTEEAIIAAAVSQAVEGNITDPDAIARGIEAITPILIDPDHVLEITALLESGTLRGREEPGEQAQWSRFDDLTRLEFAACRALFWAMTGYNDAGDGTNPFLGLTDGREVMLNVVVALPRIAGSAREYLLGCVGEARYQASGMPIFDKSYLPDFLALRGAFADHEALFFRLLSIMKETMTPEEIGALDSIVADPDNPTAVREQITSLFDAGQHDLALAVARQAFSASTLDAVKRAISSAVVVQADEPEAADFIVERIADTKRWTGLWLALGLRERGSEALDASYAAIYSGLMSEGDGDDSRLSERAREFCVTGMVGVHEERLLEIFNQESSPRIRGQTLLTLSFRKAYTPKQEHLVLLRRGLFEDETVDPIKGVGAAFNMAAKAPRGSELRENGIALLEQIRVSLPSERAREYATKRLAELNRNR